MALDVTVGGAASDSYVTLAEWQAYWLARNVDLSMHGHDAQHEANLRQAADWIDRQYTFAGTRTNSDQRRDWPRVTTIYVEGWAVFSDIIPQDIKYAQMELAYLIHEGLTPWATIEGSIVSERVKAGPVESETTFAGGKSTPRLVAIEGLLKPYTAGGTGYGQVRMLRG